MKIQLNGEPREIPAETTVSELLILLEIRAERVAVEIGTQVIKKADHASRALREGEEVEVVAFVGGG